MNGNTILIEGLITSLIKNGGATPCGIFEILDQNGNVIPGTTTTPELGIPAKTHALPTASPNLKRHLDLAFNADVQQLRTNTNNNNIAANSLFNILNILDRGRTNAVYSYGHVTDKSKQLSFATEEDVVNFAKEFANLYRIMNNQNFEDFINNTINISTAFQLFGKRADYLIDPNNFRNPGYMRPISIGEDHVDYEIKLAQKNNFTPRFNFNTGNFRPRYRGELDSTYSQQSTWWQKNGVSQALLQQKYTEALTNAQNQLAQQNSQGTPTPAAPAQQNGQPQNGQPQNGQPQNGQPQNGQPQNGQPQNGQPQNGQPQNGQPQQNGQGNNQNNRPQGLWQRTKHRIKKITNAPINFYNKRGPVGKAAIIIASIAGILIAKNLFSVIDGGFLNNVSKWIYILKAGGAKNNAELFLKNNILNEFGGLAASLLAVTGFYSVLGSIITRVANRFRNPAQQNGQPQAAPAQQNGQPQRTPAPAAPAQQNGQPQRTPAPAVPAQQNGQPQRTPAPAAPAQQNGQPQNGQPQQNGPTIIQTPPRSNQNAQNIQNPTPAATHIATNLVQLLLNTNNDIPEAYRQITAQLQNPNQSTQMKQQFIIIQQTLKDIATQNNIDLTQQPVRRHP